MYNYILKMREIKHLSGELKELKKNVKGMNFALNNSGEEEEAVAIDEDKRHNTSYITYLVNGEK